MSPDHMCRMNHLDKAGYRDMTGRKSGRSVQGKPIIIVLSAKA